MYLTQHKTAFADVPKNELKNVRNHVKLARNALDKLLPGLSTLVTDIQNSEIPEKAIIRQVRKMLRSQSTFQRYLKRYYGTERMDTSVRGLHRATVNLVAKLLLGDLRTTDFWKKQKRYLTKSYQIIELDKAQGNLRETIPEDLRQFLPRHLVIELDSDGHISEVTDRFVNEIETLRAKRERQKSLLIRYNRIVKSVRKDMESSDPRTQLSAIITSIVMETGIRPGKAKNKTTVTIGDEKVEVQTFGATTLKRKHVQIVRDNFAHIEFVGKAGSLNRAEITDRTTIKALRQYIDQGVQDNEGGGEGDSPYLFVTKDGERLNYGMLRRYFKKQTSLKGIKITDFRKLKATRTVLRNLHKMQEELYRDIRKFVEDETEDLKEQVARRISKTVELAYLQAQTALSHHDVKTTIKNYVNPEVLLRYLSRGQASQKLETVILQGKDKLVLDIDKFIQNATKGRTASLRRALKIAYLDGTLGALLDELEEDLEADFG